MSWCILVLAIVLLGSWSWPTRVSWVGTAEIAVKLMASVALIALAAWLHAGVL